MSYLPLGPCHYLSCGLCQRPHSQHCHGYSWRPAKFNFAERDIFIQASIPNTISAYPPYWFFTYRASENGRDFWEYDCCKNSLHTIKYRPLCYCPELWLSIQTSFFSVDVTGYRPQIIKIFITLISATVIDAKVWEIWFQIVTRLYVCNTHSVSNNISSANCCPNIS